MSGVEFQKLRIEKGLISPPAAVNQRQPGGCLMATKAG